MSHQPKFYFELFCIICSLFAALYFILVAYVITPRLIKAYGPSDIKIRKWVKQRDWIIRSRFIYLLLGAAVWLTFELF